jgi:hypothetical protein
MLTGRRCISVISPRWGTNDCELLSVRPFRFLRYPVLWHIVQFGCKAAGTELLFPQRSGKWWYTQSPSNNSNWSSTARQMAFINSFERKNGISSLDAWYGAHQPIFCGVFNSRFLMLLITGVAPKAIVADGGGTLMRLHGNSIWRLLKSTYPHHEWIPWSFQRSQVPQGYWADSHNCRQFFDSVGQKLHISQLEDWYTISYRQLASAAPAGIVSHKQGRSLAAKLAFAYPEHQWDVSKFARTKASHFKSSSALSKEEINSLSHRLFGTLVHMESWYSVSQKQLGEMPLTILVSSLLNHFPEHQWLMWRFQTPVPRGFWKDPVNQRSFLRWLCDILYPTEPMEASLYRITAKDLKQHGGAGLVQLYQGRISKLVSEAFPRPTSPWKPWKFQNLPKDFWSHVSPRTAREFVDELGAALKIPPENLAGWYRVSVAQRNKALGKSLTRLSGDKFRRILQLAYPDHVWDEDILRAENKRSSQAHLKNVLRCYLDLHYPGATCVRFSCTSWLGFNNSAPLQDNRKLQIFRKTWRIRIGPFCAPTPSRI